MAASPRPGGVHPAWRDLSEPFPRFLQAWCTCASRSRCQRAWVGPGGEGFCAGVSRSPSHAGWYLLTEGSGTFLFTEGAADLPFQLAPWGPWTSGFSGNPRCLLTRPAVLPPTKGTTGGGLLLVIERGCLRPPSRRAHGPGSRLCPWGSWREPNASLVGRLPCAAVQLSARAVPPPWARPALDPHFPLDSWPDASNSPLHPHQQQLRLPGLRGLGSVLGAFAVLSLDPPHRAGGPRAWFSRGGDQDRKIGAQGSAAAGGHQGGAATESRSASRGRACWRRDSIVGLGLWWGHGGACYRRRRRRGCFVCLSQPFPGWVNTWLLCSLMFLYLK